MVTKQFLNRNAAREYCSNAGIPHTAIVVKKRKGNKNIVTVPVHPSKVGIKGYNASKGTPDKHRAILHCSFK